jgi:aryl-alcohol dehydrogenase
MRSACPAVTHARAAVLRTPGGPLALEEIEIEDPRPDEVLVRLVSVGICRTDTHALREVAPPAVLGHEGAGVVERTGANVTKVHVGQPVALTFHSCGTCPRCLRGQVAYCDRFLPLNFSGRRPDGSSALSANGEAIAGHFLGQSSFATHALAHERSVVPLPDDVDLRPIGPFGCGFQTGAGAVLNALRPRARSSLAVFGAGAVGLAAVAAAALVGADPIVAVDVVPERLERARTLGATEVVDARREDAARALADLAPGGLDFSLETTGAASVLAVAVGALSTRGVCGVIGAGGSPEMVLDWRTVLNGRTVTGIIAGDSVPDLFLPELVALYRAGRFPVDSLIEYFPFEDINAALEASEAGRVVKPVLTF